MKSSDDTGALHGVRVIDLSRILAGPWATQVLADLGAEVIKVETPAGGDGTRAWGPPFIDDDKDDNSSRSDAAYFMSCNRNKRSVCIDFSTPEGARLVRDLVSTADVLVQNFKVGGLTKYGLDEARLRAENPSLIYCSISGFGSTGPYASRPGYDFLIQAMGGLMSITGAPDDQPGGQPMKTGVAICDLFTGLYAANAIQAALIHREKSGVGQHIDCSLLDAQIAMLANQGSNWLVGHRVPERLGNEHPNIMPYKAYEVADGHFILAVGNDGQYQRFCRVIDRSELADDERFISNPQRVVHRQALDDILVPVLKRWQRDELLQALESANVPAGPIRSVDEVFDDPHVTARGLKVTQTRTSGTPVDTVGFPVQLSETPATYRHAPPELGEGTDVVLERILGLTDEELIRFRADKIIG